MNAPKPGIRPVIAGQVPRVESLDPRAFRLSYVEANRPVVITGMVSKWKAVSTWNLAYLRGVLGKATLRLYTSSDGAFRAHPERGFHESLWQRLTAEQYIDWIEADRREPHLLLPHQSLLTKFPRLGLDIEIPPYVNPKSVRDVNFWLGAGGNVTPLHCDQYDNLLAQVVGTKRVLLARPSLRACLYPYSPFDRIPPVTSRVNIENSDLTRFPRLARAEFLEAVIAPGDMLFIPVHWWHQVHGIGLNVSVNFWWEALWHNLWKHPSYMLSMSIFNAQRATRCLLADVHARLTRTSGGTS